MNSLPSPAMSSVLVVDDHGPTRDALQRLFGRMGFEAAAAAGGAEALALLGDGRFDLVILDWMMPQMDGLEVLRRLRADARTAGQPVVVYTAAGDPRVERQALSLGAVECVSKSGGFIPLYEKVRHLLPA